MFVRIIERCVVRVRLYHVHTFDLTDGPPRSEPDILTYDAATPPPRHVTNLYRRYAGQLNALVMLRRLERGQAIMLAMAQDGDLTAYGWLQAWSPVQREFWWLDKTGVCCGPYWTHPAQRGQGIYGRLLRHSLHLCAARFAGLSPYIWARADNAASNRGIAKAGFRSLGVHRVAMYLFGAVRRHETVSGAENQQ